MQHTGTTLIKNGTVFDGSGAGGVRTDVLIENDRIADLGDFGEVSADQTIDAAGKFVCPGFIDPHNHADTEVQGGILQQPLADNLVRQGITTVVGNQCGGGTYPVGAFLDAVDKTAPCINIAMLASHGRTRAEAMHRTSAADPSPEAWALMRELLREEMEAGAFGVTAGPLGRTQQQMPTAELVEAGRAVAPFGGVYASHIRDEGETNRHLEAIGEVYTVARDSGAKGHVSHLKLWGHPNWGTTDSVIEIFDRAKAEGVVLAADQYPYIGGYRGMFSLLWDHQNPTNPDARWRANAVTEVERQLDLLGGPDRLIISSHEQNDPLDGKTIAEAGQILGIAAAEVVPELYLRTPRPRLSAFFLAMQEQDVRVFMNSEHTMAGTDSHIRIPGSGASHPRNFGTYPRLLGKYVREEKLMDWARMICRMTSRVADQFGISERGRLRKGDFADIVVFNPATVRDRSTWQSGYLYPVGIESVLVNGGIEVANEQFCNTGFGRALRRT